MSLLCFRLATVDESASRIGSIYRRDMFRKVGNPANDVAQNSQTSYAILFSDRPVSPGGAGRTIPRLVTLCRRAR